MRHIEMHYYTREAITEMAWQGYAAVIPLAATEQHGPHLPVFTDALICEHIAFAAGARAADQVPLLVAPVMPIGCSQHHLSFGGTLSFTSSTYLRMLHDIGESLVSGGFRKIIFLNAHGGNDALMTQVAQDLAVKHPIWTASASYWNLARPALREAGADAVGLVPGHAGGFETSAILELRPDLVRTEHLASEHPQRSWIGGGPAGAFIGRHGELTGCDGYTDAPASATAELGRKYLDIVIDCVADWLVRTVRAMNQGERER
jgi:creatinine amidohydrolase